MLRRAMNGGLANFRLGATLLEMVVLSGTPSSVSYAARLGALSAILGFRKYKAHLTLVAIGPGGLVAPRRQ